MSSGKERKISENVVPLAQAATIVARAGRTADGRYLRSGAEREKKRRKMLQVASSLFFFSGEGRSVLCVVPPGYHQVRLWTCSSYYLLGRLFIRPLHCPCFRVRIHQSVAPLFLVIPIICFVFCFFSHSKCSSYF